MSLLEIAASNPFRVPTWRWQRAETISAGEGLPTTKQRDGLDGHMWIKKALRFIEIYTEAETDTDKLLLAEEHPDIYWAHWLFLSESPQKHAIESRLLARQDDKAISFRCGVPPRTIAAYEALFFEVRSKLQHRSYILNCVMGPAIHQGIKGRAYDLLWKLYGYFLGPYVIDAIESKFSNPIWCESPESVNAAILDDAISTLKLKAAMSVKTVEVNQYTQLSLMDQFTKFIEIERSTDSSSNSESQILDNISAMMTALPFSVGGRNPRANQGFQVNSPGVEEFKYTAVELNYEESMRLAMNKPIVFSDNIKNMVFPEKPHVEILDGTINEKN